MALRELATSLVVGALLCLTGCEGGVEVISQTDPPAAPTISTTQPGFVSGITAPSWNSHSLPVALAWPVALVLRDGNVTVVGRTDLLDGDGFERTPDAFVARLDSAGELDPSFAAKGWASTDYGGYLEASGVRNTASSRIDDAAWAAVVDGDKLVTAGHCRGMFDNYAGMACLTRYASDGSLDPGFGTGGISVPLGNGWTSLYDVQRRVLDGRYVVAGIIKAPTATGVDFFTIVQRINRDGTPDTTFTGFQSGALGTKSGHLLLQGERTVLAGGEGFVVTRLLDDGSTDPSFGSGGLVSGGDGQVTALLERPDGRLLLVGSRDLNVTMHDQVIDANAPPNLALKLFQLTPDGQPDTDFGPGGVLELGPVQSYVTAAAMRPDGHVIALLSDATGSTLLQVTAAGAMDSQFGTNGTLDVGPISPLGVGSWGSHALLLDGESAFVAGTRLSGGVKTPYVVRLALGRGQTPQ
jgi:uncharacterized delta-60 repeat protein